MLPCGSHIFDGQAANTLSHCLFVPPGWWTTEWSRTWLQDAWRHKGHYDNSKCGVLNEIENWPKACIFTRFLSNSECLSLQLSRPRQETMHEIVFPRQFHRQLKDLYDRGNAEAEGRPILREAGANGKEWFFWCQSFWCFQTNLKSNWLSQLEGMILSNDTFAGNWSWSLWYQNLAQLLILWKFNRRLL